MQMLTSLFDPSKGAGFQAQGANIASPSTTQQANTAYNQTQQGIGQQQALVNAMGAQNGLGNQSSVFNQLQGVANGTGPNPAQAMLNQATGANTANQAALMAGQRGSGANPALMARQAAQQGAANQQNAAGQGATMQANQSLGALGQLGGIAGQQVAQQQGATSALNQQVQGQQSNILSGIQGQNQANVGMQSNMNTANAGIAQGNQQAQAGLISGLGQGAMAALGQIGMARGGMVPHYDTGTTNVQAPAAPAPTYGAQSSFGKALQAGAQGMQGTSGTPNNTIYGGMENLGKSMAGGIGQGVKALSGAIGGGGPTAPEGVPSSGDWASAMGANSATNTGAPSRGMMAHGGKVPAMVSPGERYLPPSEVEKVARGEKSADKAGERIPGKAKVKGDSLKNDTVPKTLEEGGVVIPRSVMESKHPHWAAHKFVSEIMKKKKAR